LKISSNDQYAIFSSGFGSNAKSLIEEGRLLGHLPALVIATNLGSPLEEVCERMGIPFVNISSQIKGIDPIFESLILEQIDVFNISWIFLAGFLKILSPSFIESFKSTGGSNIINIHPSLLPQYPGLGAYRKAFSNNDSQYGHTIHLVNEVVDGGEILRQQKLDFKSGSSFEDFEAAGKLAENRSYTLFLRDLLTGDFQARSPRGSNE
jgi:phosphoribosylglycinamide formyltransferase-1